MLCNIVRENGKEEILKAQPRGCAFVKIQCWVLSGSEGEGGGEEGHGARLGADECRGLHSTVVRLFYTLAFEYGGDEGGGKGVAGSYGVGNLYARCG